MEDYPKIHWSLRSKVAQSASIPYCLKLQADISKHKLERKWKQREETWEPNANLQELKKP
jgi:hypothetical protein